MTGKICVVNLKGGCGKTTVATHLAAAFALSGLNTAIGDFDRQRNALLWLKLRGKRKPVIRGYDWRDDFGKSPAKVQRLIVDCPASLRVKHAREVIRESDLVVVPVLPSVFDEQSTRKFLKELDRIKPIRKGKKPVLLLANRYRVGSIAALRLEEYALEAGFMLSARIPDRSIYPQIAEQGLTVFDRDTKPMRAQQVLWLPLITAIEDRLHEAQLPGAVLPKKAS